MHADIIPQRPPSGDAEPVAPRPRVLLAEDHTLVREGLLKLLADGLEILAAVPDGRALISAAEQYAPDVVLLDVSMPLLNGFDAARQLRRLAPHSRIIFVTMHAEPDYVHEAFRAGAQGYVVKSAASAELRFAIREVAGGGMFVSPATGVSLDDLLREPREGLADGLSPRQREVLQLVAEGRPAREIAEVLGISRKTVEFHKANMMRVLGLRSTAELTRHALEHGLVGKL